MQSVEISTWMGEYREEIARSNVAMPAKKLRSWEEVRTRMIGSRTSQWKAWQDNPRAVLL